jgi:uncharacterized protein
MPLEMHFWTRKNLRNLKWIHRNLAPETHPAITRTMVTFFGVVLFCVPPARAEIPRAPSPPAPQASSIVDAAKEILNEMVAGQFDKVEARYGAKMAVALPPGKLAAAWDGLTVQVGAFQSISQTRTDEAGEQRIVTLVCKFEKAELDARIAFDDDGRLAGLLFRPHDQPVAPWITPSYAEPSSFTESSLTLVNGKYELPGTLAVPKDDGPFPALVLVHGSGPHDPDETIGPNKPFKDLAWGLASRGIAVYRYTKRTAKYGTEVTDDPASLTVDDEVIRDARAAVALLTKQPKVDPQRVYLLGHSLGAYLAPRIASGDSEIAGLILLTAPSEPIEQLDLEQLRYVASLNGVPSAQAQQQIQLAEGSVKEIESPELKRGDTITFLGTNSPASYWIDLRGYHPEAVAASLPIPILILQGERDYQIPMSDFDAWKTALAKKKNATLQTFPNLNHMLVSGSGPSSPEEYLKPGHVDIGVINAIADWLRTASERSPAVPAKSAN